MIIDGPHIYEGFSLFIVQINKVVTELMNQFASLAGVRVSRLCLLFKNLHDSHLDFVVSSCLLQTSLCCHACKRAAGELCQWCRVYAAGEL